MRSFLEPPNDPTLIQTKEGKQEELFYLPPPPPLSTLSLPKILKLKQRPSSEIPKLSESINNRSNKNDLNENESSQIKERATFEQLMFHPNPNPNPNINPQQTWNASSLDEDSTIPFSNSLDHSSSLFAINSTKSPKRDIENEKEVKRLKQTSLNIENSLIFSERAKPENGTITNDEKDLCFLHLLLETMRDHLQWVSSLKLCYETFLQKETTNDLEVLFNLLNSGKIIAIKESLMKEKEVMDVRKKSTHTHTHSPLILSLSHHIHTLFLQLTNREYISFQNRIFLQ